MYVHAQVFKFGCLVMDVLEIEVRHKWNAERPSVSHFLGKISFPISQCLNKNHDPQSVDQYFQI